MNYYDIDDILANETKLKVNFNHTIKNFGFIQPQSHKLIMQKKNVEVPYFLIQFLLQNNHCQLSDDPIQNVVLQNLRAKASIVPLPEIYKHFFYIQTELKNTEMIDIFYERMSEYSVFLLKEAFSEDDVYMLDFKEKKIVIKGRSRFQKFQKFFIKNH